MKIHLPSYGILQLVLHCPYNYYNLRLDTQERLSQVLACSYDLWFVQKVQKRLKMAQNDLKSHILVKLKAVLTGPDPVL